VRHVKLAHEGHELEVITESIDVTAMVEPDPDWKYTDSSGHVHRYDDSAPDGPYPTLEYRAWHECHGDGLDCDYEDDQDLCYPVLGCKRCGEHVVPGTRTGQSRSIPGLTTYLIDGEPVSKQAAEDFMAAARWEREASARRPPLTPGQLDDVRAAINAAGLRLWLKSMFGPSAARRMIRDAWVSLDRDDWET